jgi:hypothetical protein
VGLAVGQLRLPVGQETALLPAALLRQTADGAVHELGQVALDVDRVLSREADLAAEAVG